MIISVGIYIQSKTRKKLVFNHLKFWISMVWAVRYAAIWWHYWHIFLANFIQKYYSVPLQFRYTIIIPALILSEKIKIKCWAKTRAMWIKKRSGDPLKHSSATEISCYPWFCAMLVRWCLAANVTQASFRVFLALAFSTPLSAAFFINIFKSSW